MMPMPLTTTPTLASTLLDAVAAASRDNNGEALRGLRTQLGYDSLDEKGRLALFRALRRKIKSAGDEQACSGALVALENAFALPYKALKLEAQRKGLARVLGQLDAFAHPPAMAGVLEREVAALTLAASTPVQETPLGSSLAAAAALPESWVRLRCSDGTLDAPRDTFIGAGYFDALINSKMQGGRDASGAYMVNADIETLRAIVHFLSHSQLPHLSIAQRSALKVQADALCLSELSARIDQECEDAALRKKIAAAETVAIADIRKRLPTANDRDTQVMAVRVFHLLMTTLRNSVLSGVPPKEPLKIDLNDTMLGPLTRDIQHVLRGSYRTSYTYAFREGKAADESLYLAALACEEVLNQTGICIIECSASVQSNNLTFRLLG